LIARRYSATGSWAFPNRPPCAVLIKPDPPK
jgi:hypothetical protein